MLEKRARRLPLELRESADGKAGPLSGYAAVFYRDGDEGTQYELWPARGTEPRAVERIDRYAFDEIMKKPTRDAAALFNHNPDLLLGREKSGTLRLSVDDQGLRYEVDPDEDNPVWKQVRQAVKRGDIDGSSFQFYVEEDEWTRNSDLEVRVIKRIARLIDVGPVTFPAYQATSTEARDALRPIRDKEASRIARELIERQATLRRLQLARLAG